ncbi:MAG: hypothetical protein HYV28_17660 [Ignavibacteriales bacterium]|nr:hypothetical protein [Ignavibacteriales bacterium]
MLGLNKEVKGMQFHPRLNFTSSVIYKGYNKIIIGGTTAASKAKQFIFIPEDFYAVTG